MDVVVFFVGSGKFYGDAIAGVACPADDFEFHVYVAFVVEKSDVGHILRDKPIGRKGCRFAVFRDGGMEVEPAVFVGPDVVEFTDGGIVVDFGGDLTVVERDRVAVEFVTDAFLGTGVGFRLGIVAVAHDGHEKQGGDACVGEMDFLHGILFLRFYVFDVPDFSGCL